MLPTLLIVDDERATREGLRSALEEEFDIYTAANASEAAKILKSEPIQLLLTDLRLGGDSGMQVLDTALALPDPPLALMMTAYGSVDTAVEAMRHGAWHFVTKPLNLDEVEMLLKRALRSRNLETENKQLTQQVAKSHKLDRLIGKSLEIQKVSELIQQVSPTRATVLIEGESGTGKEVVAHLIHHLSGRPASKMVTVHCAALSPQLLESELFGHEKGAFTGAAQRRIGRFEQADGGTIFLDEIGEIDAATQIKLLRILSEFGVEVTLGEIHVGPVITRYEVVPAPGVRVEKISGLDKNIALGMRAQSVRILAPIPGKAAVGVEVPNQRPTPVGMRELLESEDWGGTKAEIPIALGKDVSGAPLVSDLAKMPHLLIAGATGSGKSVCINSIVASILYSKSPKDLRMIMVDPKVVELKIFNSLPHMLIPVVTEPKKVPAALKWLLKEMEQRYQIFAKVNVRNIVGFNQRKRGGEEPPPPPEAQGVLEGVEV